MNDDDNDLPPVKSNKEEKISEKDQQEVKSGISDLLSVPEMRISSKRVKNAKLVSETSSIQTLSQSFPAFCLQEINLDSKFY